MRSHSIGIVCMCLLAASAVGVGCSGSSSPQGGAGGTNASTGGSAAAGTTSSGGQGGGSGGSTGGTASGGTAGSGGQGAGAQAGRGGSIQTGGQAGTGAGGSGGQAGQGSGGVIPAGGSGGQGSGGVIPAGGSGGQGSGGQVGGGSGGSTGGGGGGGGSKSGCVPTKTWGTADPSNPGPFEVVTETNVGPENGAPDAKWSNQKPHFNLYRPKDMSQGYCHPIITWANGTNDQPKTYEVLIKQLVSHGFVVVASLSSQTLSGDPLPQVAGVNWMIEENENPSSALYHHLDTAHIGATGHSQGGAATVSSAVADPRIVAIAPIAGAYPRGAAVPTSTKINGPAALLCGGKDNMVPCDLVKPAFDNINDQPVMLADNLGDDHGSWIGSIKNPYMIAVTGWMRVHLMGDTANRTMFYGASCKLCTDAQHWIIQRKMMDQ